MTDITSGAAPLNDVDLQYLRSAIAVALRARNHGNHPFGALLVDEHQHVLVEAENTVVTDRDCTGHAETNAVRQASRQFSPEQLARSTLYASTEPCAMCAAAIHWSGIGRVVFALSEEHLYELVGPSPDHLMLPCREVFARTARSIDVAGPMLEDEARTVHIGFWNERRD